jgi:site-specific recombinase XerD
MNSNILELSTLIDGFRLSCLTEGKSARTVEWYIAFLNRFRQFLEAKQLSTDLREIGKNHVREFIRFLQTEAENPRNGMPLSGATVQGYVRTLKAFFSWAIREEYIAQAQIGRIQMPKAPLKIVNTFSAEQVRQMLGLCQVSKGDGQRNLAIILLLLDTGVRVSELVHIELDDVDLEGGSIRIRVAKGNRERIVPIGSLVQKVLWKYIHSGRPEPLTGQVTGLFLSDRGLPFTRSGIQQLLRRCGKRAGITSTRVSPHTFRHTFAKNYLLNGGDIFSLQRILGHSSLASVRVYLNLFAPDIKKQHLRFSPVDNLAPTLTGCRW